MKKLAVFLAILSLLAFAGAASAGVIFNDHLKCYKIKDSTKFTAEADLFSFFQDPPFPPEAGCKIKGKAKHFCAPVDKTNVQNNTAPGPDPNYSVATSGQLLDNDFICYKVKCPKPLVPIADTEVTDQFDTRTLSKFKAQLLCMPAVKTCGGAQAPQCNGVCPFDDPCVDMGGFCGCL